MLAQYDEKDGFSFGGQIKISDDVEKALTQLEPGMLKTTTNVEGLAMALGTSDQKFINFCTDLKNGNITLKEGQTYLQAYQENVTSLSARLKSFATSAKAFFKNLGGNLLAGTINALGGMLISSVVSLIGVGVSKLYKQISGKAAEETKQEIQQLGETARSEFDSIQQNLSSTISTVDEVKQHYAELAQGVGDLGKATQNQGTLTTDDYKDFLDISNQLSDLFPTLTQGYDDNGNAIINLNGDVNTITSSLEHLIDVQKEVAAQEMSDKMPDIYKDYRQTVDDYANKYNNTQESATGYDYLRVNYKNVDSFYGIDGVDKKELRKALEDQGLDDDTVELLMDYGAKNLNQIAQQKAQKALQNLYEKYSEEVNKYADKIEQENKKFGVQVSQTLYNDATYQDIAENDSTKKSIIDSIIPNLNYDTLSAGFDGEWKNAYKQIMLNSSIIGFNLTFTANTPFMPYKENESFNIELSDTLESDIVFTSDVYGYIDADYVITIKEAGNLKFDTYYYNPDTKVYILDREFTVKNCFADEKIYVKGDTQLVTSSSTHELGKDCNFILPRLVNTYQSDDEEIRNRITSNLKCNVQITYNPTAMIGYGYKS